MQEQKGHCRPEGEGSIPSLPQTFRLQEGVDFSDLDHLQIQLQNPKVMPPTSGNQGASGNAGGGK
jgi:hypothetical protein